MSTTQNATPWPAGVTHRYLTIVGATVDLRGDGQDTRSVCTGCGRIDGPYLAGAIHRAAQTHAERCRALPRPTGSAA